jgi:ribosome-associated heat shock protein Hsp15
LAGKGARDLGARPAAAPRPTLRIDKWLWQARFFKTRALAAATVEEGRVRINGQPTAKPGHAVGAGDVLTFAQGGRIRVIRILALGQRRGPAGEAQALYLDLDGGTRQGATPSPLE